MDRIPLTIQKKLERVIKDVRVNDQSVVSNDIANVPIKTINNKSIVGTGNLNIAQAEGGEPDYEDLDNKPSINNVELDGDLTLSDLGIAAASHNHNSSYSAIGHNHDDDYADKSHFHSTTDITGLTSALANKSEVGHEHSQYATETQLAGKQDTLVSGTNIATINDRSLLDGGNIVITGGGGGEGGTSNYDELSNKPKINEVTLAGNKSSSDLGLAALSHTHVATDISAGEISIDRLPVGTSTTQVANGAHSHSEYYTKPSAGIPKTDLELAVRTSLDKADSALQSVPDATSSVKGIAKLGASGGAAAYSHTHSGYVPTTRTVNGKALSADVTLTASDIGAATSSHKHTTLSGLSANGAVLVIDRLRLQWGKGSVTVDGTGIGTNYKDVDITFGDTYAYEPTVVASISTSASGTSSGPNRYVAIKSVSTTGCTLRVWNGNASSTSIGYTWHVMGALPKS